MQARTQVARADRALLTGIAECGRCHGPVWTRTSGAGGYYYDAASKRGKPCSAGGSAWRTAAPDAAVERVVLELATPGYWFEEAAALVAAKPVDEDTEGERERLTGKLERLTTAYVEGALPVEAWRREKDRIEGRLAVLAERPAGNGAVASMAKVSSIAELWPRMTQLERGELVRLLFERVSLDTAAREVVGVYPHPELADLVALRASWMVAMRPRQDSGVSRNHPHRWYDLSELVA